MTDRKTTRAKPKEKEQPKPKPLLKLDADRWEEIIAIGILILALLTALGAFGLSGGFLLDSWTRFLRLLFGWGVYIAPVILFGLGIWLILDALDRTWNIGWERPIAVGLLYFMLLAILHWLSTPARPLEQPGAFQGGGLIGWGIASLLINAFGEVGTLFALVALIGIGLILLFNISLPELGHRVAYLLRVVRNLPQEIQNFRKPREPMINPPPPTPIDYRRSSTPAIQQPTRQMYEEPPPIAQTTPMRPASIPPTPRGAVSARIIGGGTSPTAPVIQREWRLPDVSQMLEESTETDINQNEIRERVHRIEETLAHFGVPAKVLEVNQGPTITQFGVEPGFVEQKGPDGRVNRVKVKVSRISALQHDLELALAAAPIRIEAPVPGKNIVGIEVPNSQISMVSLRGVMESETFKSMKSKLKIALGQDVAGQSVGADLTTMPHLLIAGATGSGKSVCLNTIIACLLATLTPDQIKFVMIDPKRVELVNFNGIPHLLREVVVEVSDAVAALQGAVTEMDRRFKLFQQRGVRNLDGYNQSIEGKPDAERLPFLIVIVDELADLMMVSAEEVERAITRLAQMARATGIHLILATQRPSVDVVTGLIKANFPSRISFAVTSQVDSRVVLDTQGAEKLLGRGDMLYMASDSSKLVRLQGCYVSDRELERIATYWKDLVPPPPKPSPRELPRAESEEGYLQEPLWEGVAPAKTPSGEDDLLPQAIEIVQQSRKASVSLLQRKLRIGYSRAARLIQLLEDQGIVGPDEGPTKGRAVLATGVAPSKPKAPRAKPAPAASLQDDAFEDFTEDDWEELDH